MATSRTSTSAFRALRARPQPVFRARPGRRAYATEINATSTAQGASPAIIGGITGGALVFAAAYGYYYMSGARTAVNSLHSTKKYFDDSVKKLQDSAPEPNEALKWLRETSLSYVAIIPGAKGYVNTAFDDLDIIRSKHGEEVDKIVKQTYDEVKSVSQKGGVSMDTAGKVWSILEKKLKDITALAGDAAEDIMNNHPEIKKKFGGNFDQLKEMGEKYGPQAKEQVDKTWEQVQSIVGKGLSMSTIPEIKKLVEEKMDIMRQFGDEAYKKGLETAKPYLDKSPKVKELLESNADALKQGDLGALWEKVKKAAESGSTDDLEKFVKSAGDQAKSKGMDMGIDVEKYMGMIPGGAEIGKQWGKIQEIGEKHGKEAKDIMSSTIDEVKSVLQKKMGEAEKLVEKSKKDAKN